MERRKEAEEPVNSGGNRRVMEERGLVGRRKEIEGGENQMEKIKFQIQMAFVTAQDPGHFYKCCFT